MTSVAPLAYHQATLAWLRGSDAQALQSLLADAEVVDPDLSDVLLRNTYRLEAAAHPGLHNAGRRAATALGLDVAIEYYQAGDGGQANASLLHQSDRAVVLFEGALLERLSDDELTAVLGHELAHRLLWTHDGGAFLAADRLLDAAAHDARTPSHYLETQRRWALACELFADRGALVAAGDLTTTVRALLKLQTGLSTVDPESYLSQAAKIDLAKGSPGSSHPEGVARAWALQQWLAGDDAEVLLTGALDVESPDLLDAQTLRDLSAWFASHVAHTPGLESQVVSEHAAGFTDPPRPLSRPTAGLPRFDEPLRVDHSDGSLGAPRPLSDATRRYLCYLLLDLATADAELADDALVAALGIAERSGLADFVDLADDELGWTDRRRQTLLTAVAR